MGPAVRELDLDLPSLMTIAEETRERMRTDYEKGMAMRAIALREGHDVKTVRRHVAGLHRPTHAEQVAAGVRAAYARGETRMSIVQKFRIAPHILDRIVADLPQRETRSELASARATIGQLRAENKQLRDELARVHAT